MRLFIRSFSAVIAYLILLIPCTAPAQERPAAATVVEVPGGDLWGEVALCDVGGRTLLRYIGLGTPSYVFPAPNGRFLVTDRLGGRLIELDFEGTVHWSWTCPPAWLKPFSALSLPGGTVLIAAGHQGVREIDRTGRLLWHAPSPVRDGFALHAIRLPDGSTLFTMHDSRAMMHRVCRVPAHATKAVAIALPFADDEQNITHVVPWKPDGSEFVLWNNRGPRAYRCTYTDDAVQILESMPLSRVESLVPDGAGGAVITREGHFVGHWHPDGHFPQWQTIFQPLAALSAPQPDVYLISYVRLGDKSWPAARSALAPKVIPSLVAWPRFWSWIAIAVAFACVLHVLAWVFPGCRREQPGSRANGSPAEPAPNRLREPWVAWRVLAVLVAGTGFTLAGCGHFYLRSGFVPPWLLLCAIGVALAVVVLETWRRLVLRERDPYWSAFQAARPKVACWPSLALGSVGVIVGGLVLFYLRSNPSWYTDQVGLWAALLIVLVCMSALTPTPPWRWRPRLSAGDLLAPAVPLLIGVFTLSYKLSDVPYNLHFDQVFYALDGLYLLEGRYGDIWALAYDVPLIGRLPEVLGLTLAGPGRLGFSLGSVLFGLSGIFATYLLGRCYRDRWTGMLAAILLAGSIPFIHFTRTNFQGDAITGAIWAITLFALAVRNSRPGLWVLAGLAVGFCFYLWAAARIAPFAIFTCGIAMALRSPRATLRRWYGPLLMMIAVLICLVPVLPWWMSDINNALPRVRQSSFFFTPDMGINWSFLKESLGEPLWRSVGWLYVIPDGATHGTLSPGANPIEAALFTIGFLIVLVEGWSLNVLLAGYTLLVVLMGGAWTHSPPQYTRLSLMTPIVAVVIARALIGLAGLLPNKPRGVRGSALVLLVLAGIFISPVSNLRTYLDYETGHKGHNSAFEASAIGHRLRELGSTYHHYLVITKRSDWSMPNGPRFAELVPYIWNLRVTEIRDLPDRLPLPPDEPATLVVQQARFDEDIAQIRRWYPQAQVEEIVGFRGRRRAGLVIIDRPVEEESTPSMK